MSVRKDCGHFFLVQWEIAAAFSDLMRNDGRGGVGGRKEKGKRNERQKKQKKKNGREREKTKNSSMLTEWKGELSV